MELYIGLAFLNLAIAYKFFKKRKKPTKYQEEQAERFFNKRCEEDGSTVGRVHTKGLSLIKTGENGYTFIKQYKLVDSSLLY